MMKKNIINLLLLFFAWNACADDLAQGISGGQTADLLAPKPDEERSSPFAYKKEGEDRYMGKTSSGPENNYIMGTNSKTELDIKDADQMKLKGTGYVVPGTFEHEKNYLTLDKASFAKDFRNKGTSAFNIAYFSDSFNYQSNNDVINRTIGQGYQHTKAGLLQLRSDQYFYKSFLLNILWAVGGGISYNSGKGIFASNASRSEVKLTLWEAPIDLGLGIEIPVYKWFTFAGVTGPSVMILAQNRNDFLNGENGKNKFQFGYGQFLNAQFKINLAGFSDTLAYDLFSESQITNMSINLEARYQNYKNFQDADIAISGTSIGIGFTFAFL